MNIAQVSAGRRGARDARPPATATRRSRRITLDTLDLPVSVVGLVLLAAAYWFSLLPEAFALLLLVLAPVTLLRRVREWRRGQVEGGLLRHPLRGDLRPYALQAVHSWLFWSLFAAALATGMFALVPAQIGALLGLPLPERIPYRPLEIALGVGALAMAGLALVPRRRTQVARNVLLGLGTVFLAVQVVRIHVPPDDPVTVDLPLTGRWAVVAGGRSVLVSHHHSFTTPHVRDALDFVRLVDGRGRDGDPERAGSWYGFGEPVLVPADGRVVSVDDTHPDDPVGQTGVAPPHGNHVVLEIGPERYAVMAHLKGGSARVSVGEQVRRGQQVAEVGDSGNSLWPHLHFHVQDRPALDEQARTVPVVFRDVVLARNGTTSRPTAADLRRGDQVSGLAP